MLRLLLISTNFVSTGINDIRWSHDDGFVVRGNNNNEIVVSSAASASSVSSPFTFKNVALVFNSNVVVNKTWHIDGSCKIYGRDKKLTFGNEGCIKLRPNANLTLQNVHVTDAGDYEVRCMDDSGSITLNKSVLQLSKDFTFSRGSMVFEKDVVISGTTTFNYTSASASTISSQSTLYLDDGVTFKYDPSSANKNLLVMEDETSALFLNGSTLHVTYTGLHLSDGTLYLDNKVTLSSEARNSGEAVEFASDLNIKMLSGAVADVHGIFKYV